MGCDIHMYIEYADKDKKRWRSFGKRINPGRNYAMFGILAGVRMETEFSYEPSGLPDNLGWESRSDNELYICEDGSEGCATMESAERWVESGSSLFIKNLKGENTWVTNPDWHSHSCLTADEYKKALEFYATEYGSKYPEPEYYVVLACLEKFNELGFESRIVFWFDN